MKDQEIKTVTHEGQVYQIGKRYIFCDELSGMLFIDELVTIEADKRLSFEGVHARYRYVVNQPLENMGVIKPAPIELVNGAAYMFDYRARKDVIGIYSVCTETISSIVDVFRSKDCTNIRRMTVEPQL
jgi:hypothetical protein